MKEYLGIGVWQRWVVVAVEVSQGQERFRVGLPMLRI